MVIVKQFIDKIKNLDNKVKKLMHIGFIFSFILCIISIISLFTYETLYCLPELFYTGISLFKTSLMFFCSLLIFGIGFDTIRKEMI